MTSKGTLATFHLTGTDPATGLPRRWPLTVENAHNRPGFEVRENGDLVSKSHTSFEGAHFATAVEAMAFALDFCGWGTLGD